MENISFDLYRLFYVVANYENISKAANALYITQPAVTQGIKKLEEQIGGNLFYRNKKGVTLTEEGKRLYKYLESSIQVLENAEKNFSKYVNLNEGKIRIRSGNMIEKMDIYNNIVRFMKDYPNIEIDIKDGISKNSVEGLVKGENDIVILNLPFTADNEKVRIIELEEKSLELYCTQEYYDEYINKKELSINDLKDLDFITAPIESNTGKLIHDFFENNNIDAQIKFTSPSANTRNFIAEQSMGILIALKDSVNNKKFIKLKIKEKLPKVKIGIATLNNDIIGFATKELIKYIKGEK